MKGVIVAAIAISVAAGTVGCDDKKSAPLAVPEDVEDLVLYLCADDALGVRGAEATVEKREHGEQVTEHGWYLLGLPVYHESCQVSLVLVSR